MPRRTLGQASRNSLWLLSGQGATLLASLAFSIVLARSLGVAAFGQYAFAVATASFLTLAASLGLDVYLVRTLARDPERGSLEWSAAILVRGGLWLAGMAVLLVALPWTTAASAARTAALILGLSTLPVLLGGCAGAVLSAREEMRSVALYQSGSHVARAALGTVALAFGWGLLGVVWASVGAALLSLGWVALRVRRDVEAHPPVRFVLPGRGRLAAVARAAAPFGIAGLLFTLYFRMNLIVLGAWRGSEEAGLYAVGFKFVEAWALLPGSVLAASFPILSRLHAEASDSFGTACRFLGRLLLAIGLPVATVVGARAEEIVLLLFGAEYRAAAPALAVLAWMAPLLGLNYALGNALFAAGRAGEVGKTEALGVGVALAAGATAIPRFGALGAAGALLATEAAVIARNAWALRRERSALPGGEAILPALPAALLAGFVAARIPLPLVLALALGALAYAALFLTGGGIRREDRAWLAARRAAREPLPFRLASPERRP